MALGKVSTRLAAAVSGVDEVVSLGGFEAAIEARKSRSGSVEAILVVYDEGEVRLSCVQSFIQCTETFLEGVATAHGPDHLYIAKHQRMKDNQ